MSTFAKVIVGALVLACVLVGLRIAVARMGLLPQLTAEQLAAIELMSQPLEVDGVDGYSAMHLLFFDVLDDEREELEQLDAVSLATEIKRRGYPRMKAFTAVTSHCGPARLFGALDFCLDEFVEAVNARDEQSDDFFEHAAQINRHLSPLYCYSHFNGPRFGSPGDVTAIAAMHPEALDTCHEGTSWQRLPDGTEVREPGCWPTTEGEVHDRLDDQVLASLGASARIRAAEAFSNQKFGEAVAIVCRDARFWRKLFVGASSIAQRKRANQELAADGVLIVDMNRRSPEEAVIDQDCFDSFRMFTAAERDLCDVNRGEYRVALRDYQMRSTTIAAPIAVKWYLEWNPRHASALAATYYSPACKMETRAHAANFGPETHKPHCSDDELAWDWAACSVWGDNVLSFGHEIRPPPDIDHKFQEHLRAITAAMQINSRSPETSIADAFWALPDDLRISDEYDDWVLALQPSETQPLSLALVQRVGGSSVKMHAAFELPLRPDP